MTNKTLPTLSAGTSIAAGDLFLTRQGADANDTKVTGTQLLAFVNANPVTGAVVKTAYFPYTTYTSYAIGQIPADDSIPQIGEGTEIFTGSYTPLFSGSLLLLDGVVWIASSDTFGAGICATFVDATSNALGVGRLAFGGSGDPQPIPVRGSMTTSGTSAITLRVRAGEPNSGKTFYINGNSGGRLFGGVLASFLRVTEIKQ